MAKLAEGEKIIGAFDYGITVTNMRVMRDVAVTVFDGEKKLKRVAEGQEYYDFPIDKVSGVYHAEEHRRIKWLLYTGLIMTFIGVLGCVLLQFGRVEGVGVAILGILFFGGCIIPGVCCMLYYHFDVPTYVYLEQLSVHAGGTKFVVNTICKGKVLELRPIAEEIGRILCVVKRESYSR